MLNFVSSHIAVKLCLIVVMISHSFFGEMLGSASLGRAIGPNCCCASLPLKVNSSRGNLARGCCCKARRVKSKGCCSKAPGKKELAKDSGPRAVAAVVHPCCGSSRRSHFYIKGTQLAPSASHARLAKLVERECNCVASPPNGYFFRPVDRISNKRSFISLAHTLSSHKCLCLGASSLTELPSPPFLDLLTQRHLSVWRL